MPVVTLKMGPSLNPDDIKEGDGVYFECTVRSNPKPYKMAWYHDVSKTLDPFFDCIILKVEIGIAWQWHRHQAKRKHIKF